MPDGASLASVSLVERAQALAARLARPSLGHHLGARRSRLHGGGAEFAEHKPYLPGDELRHVDWRVWGRMDRLVVRRHESDRSVDVVLVVDRSASMDFGTVEVKDEPGAWTLGTKWANAAVHAMALAQIFLRVGDRVGLVVADGEGLHSLPPRGAEGHLVALAETLAERPPDGASDLRAATEEGVRLARRGLLILISDLLSEPEDAWLPALRLHGGRGREAWLLHVLDPAERSFPWTLPHVFIDPETGARLTVNPQEVARGYRERVEAFLERQRQRCLDASVRYGRVELGEESLEPLLTFLEGAWV